MPDAQVNAAYTPIGENNAIPGALSRPAKASSKAGRGQFCTVDPSDGMASLNGGATPGQISCGVADVAFISDESSVAGNAVIRLTQRHSKGLPASTESGDGFSQADYCAPFFIADENTPGKLSNFGGSNRSFGGLVFGVDERSNPLLWAGPVASCIARAVHVIENLVGASYQVADASASAATAETAIARTPVHGVVTAIEFTGAAAAAHASNFATVTLSKRDGAGGAAVVLGVFSTETGEEGSITAFTPAAFTLSVVAGALNLLETDIVTATIAKAASGVVLTGSIRLVQKAI